MLLNKFLQLRIHEEQKKVYQNALNFLARGRLDAFQEVYDFMERTPTPSRGLDGVHELKPKPFVDWT